MHISLVGFFKRYLSTPAGLTDGRNYLDECESIRGLAILLVVLFHWLGTFTAYQPQPDPNPLAAFIYAGNSGVTLFFVLSGFLLSMPWFKGRTIRLNAFYRNRLLRIMPLYFILVSIAAFFHRDVSEGIRSLLFWDLGLLTLYPFGSVWKTLAIEMQFYLLLPLLMTFTLRNRLRFLGLFLLVLLSLGSIVLLAAPEAVFSSHVGALLQGNLLGRWPNFLMGITCAFLYVKLDGQNLKEKLRTSWLGRGGGDLVLLLVLFLLAMQFSSVATLGIFPAETLFPARHAIEGILWGVLILAIILLPLGSVGLFVNPVLNTLGILSYSIYLLHYPLLISVMNAVTTNRPMWIATPGWPIGLLSVGLLLILLVLSALTYVGIEKPFLSLKSRK